MKNSFSLDCAGLPVLYRLRRYTLSLSLFTHTLNLEQRDTKYFSQRIVRTEERNGTDWTVAGKMIMIIHLCCAIENTGGNKSTNL